MGQPEESSYLLDLEAFSRAEARARASVAVAGESFDGAVRAMHAEGRSVRTIAAATKRSKSAVARALLLESGPRFQAEREQVDAAEYRAARDAAWVHYPPARTALDVPGLAIDYPSA